MCRDNRREAGGEHLRGPHDVQGLLRQRPQLRDFLTEGLQLVARRQRAAPQQMRSCFEADAPGQLLELIATNDELARQTSDVAEPGLRRYDPVQPARLYRGADETAFTSW